MHMKPFFISCKAQIDNYEMVPATQVANLEVDKLLRNQNSVSALYKDSADRKITTAREQFLDYLGNKFNQPITPLMPPKKATTMEALLGEKGLELYQLAIAEESKSRNFRDAVFLRSTQYFEGPEFNKKMVLWVGGPSASGKTYAATTAINAMAKNMPIKPNSNQGNNVVFVDGGIEREMSQMRQLVLQLALAHGYKGIEDLHDNTKLNIKDYVKEAAVLDAKLNLVIPETFAEYMISMKRFSTPGAYRQDEMKKYDNMQNVEQAFCEITGVENQEERFQTSVKFMGESRAYLGDEVDFTIADIKMNNREIPCESKKYGESGFIFGKYASEVARDNLQEMHPNGWYINIKNDLMFVKKNERGSWIECASDDTPQIKIASRDFERWKYLKNKTPTTPDLSEWFQKEKADNHLARPLVQIKRNNAHEQIEPPLPQEVVEQFTFDLNHAKNELNDYIAHLQMRINNIPKTRQQYAVESGWFELTQKRMNIANEVIYNIDAVKTAFQFRPEGLTKYDIHALSNTILNKTKADSKILDPELAEVLRDIKNDLHKTKLENPLPKVSTKNVFK